MKKIKKIKTILFTVAIVLASLFLCSAGCQNAADSGSSGGGATGMTEAQAIAAIKNLNANSPMLNVTLTGVASISSNLRDALRNAPYGKINLDLSQTQIPSIGYDAFESCRSLKSVNIPSSVTTIGNYAFQGCESLTSVNIPSGVTSISDGVFQDCKSLTSVNIPSSVTSIGDRAFKGCESLTSVNIPSGVTSIGNRAFQNCISLASVYVKATITPSGGNNMFDNCHYSLKIYVPSSSSVAAYKGASSWSDYADKIVADPNN